jgi:hypothetical protein
MSSTQSEIPNMQYINRQLPITRVAVALDLKLDGGNRIHCWHPERHKNGDRTASVGIRSSNNTVKCFACDSRPMGSIDLVMDVLELESVGDAALWSAARFEVPTIPAGKRLEDPDRWRGRVGHENGLELLIRSGLWGTLSAPAQAIAAVLLAMSEKKEPTAQETMIRISYTGTSRYSGASSSNSIRKGLIALCEIGFLRCPEAGLRLSPQRGAASYIVTPNSDELHELAQTFSKQMKSEIAAERELRNRLRIAKTRAWREKSLL